MRPRILYDLSRRLAILLEEGLRGARGSARIPVLLCHPLDALEGRDGQGAGTLGVLYPTRIVPEKRWRDATFSLDGHRPDGGRPEGRVAPADLRERLRLPPLWVRVRFAFIVTGGSVEDQLGAMAAALRTIHDHPTVALGEERREAGGSAEGGAKVGEGAPGEAPPRQDATGQEGAEDAEAGTFPLSLVEDGEGWRDLGLREHVLAISLEVTISIPSERTEAVQRVIEREVRVEEAAP